MTRVVEDSIASVGGINHIRSTVTDGVSRTIIEFAIGTNTDRAVNDVRDAVSKVRENLPQTIDEPQVGRVDTSGGDVMGYSVSAAGLSETQLGWFVDNEVTRSLLAVHGGNDETVPPRESAELAEAAREAVRVNIRSATHTLNAAHPFVKVPRALELAAAVTSRFIGAYAAP